jgi:hypothetical protein
MRDEGELGELSELARVRRARLAGRRFGLGIVIVVAALFIGSSSYQIVPAVFGFGPASRGGADPVPEPCAAGVSRLLHALDRAGPLALSPGATDGQDEQAHSRFIQALSPEWDDAQNVERACQGTPSGIAAWAAIERLRRGSVELWHRGRTDLAPLRAEVLARLPANLRQER